MEGTRRLHARTDGGFGEGRRRRMRVMGGALLFVVGVVGCEGWSSDG